MWKCPFWENIFITYRMKKRLMVCICSIYINILCRFNYLLLRLKCFRGTVTKQYLVIIWTGSSELNVVTVNENVKLLCFKIEFDKVWKKLSTMALSHAWWVIFLWSMIKTSFRYCKQFKLVATWNFVDDLELPSIVTVAWSTFAATSRALHNQPTGLRGEMKP